MVYFYYLVVKKFDAVYFVAGLLAIVVLLVCAPTTNAKSFIPLTVIDQASDGDYCNSIYICNLSDQELTSISSQDNQGYQIKDHTNIFSTGAWPQIYFAPDRYLEFIFTNPNLSSQDTILSSILTISHKVNEPQGSKGLNYDIKLEISKDGSSTWEVISTNLWPSVTGSFFNFQISLPTGYLNATDLNNLLTRLSIYGDDGYANLSSIIDLVKLDIDYYNPLTNTPPLNTISVPNENQELSGEATFSVSITDDFGITEYQLNLLDKNKNLITTCHQAATYSTLSISTSCQINTKNYSNNQYYLQVKSKDNASEWAITDRLVTINNISTTASTTTSTSTTSTTETSSSDTVSSSNDPIDNLTTLVESAGSNFASPYSWQPTEIIKPTSQALGTPPETKVLGASTEKPKTWMLLLSIFLLFSYLIFLLSRRR